MVHCDWRRLPDGRILERLSLGIDDEPRFDSRALSSRELMRASRTRLDDTVGPGEEFLTSPVR